MNFYYTVLLNTCDQRLFINFPRITESDENVKKMKRKLSRGKKKAICEHYKLLKGL